MRNDDAVTGTTRQRNGIKRFSQGADLVDLDQNGVTCSLGNATLKRLGLGSQTDHHRPAEPYRR